MIKLSHLAAIIFESAVVGDYLTTLDGKPVKLQRASESESKSDANAMDKPIIATISCGPQARIEITYMPATFRIDKSKLILSPEIKKKN